MRRTIGIGDTLFLFTGQAFLGNLMPTLVIIRLIFNGFYCSFFCRGGCNGYSPKMQLSMTSSSPPHPLPEYTRMRTREKPISLQRKSRWSIGVTFFMISVRSVFSHFWISAYTSPFRGKKKAYHTLILSLKEYGWRGQCQLHSHKSHNGCFGDDTLRCICRHKRSCTDSIHGVRQRPPDGKELRSCSAPEVKGGKTYWIYRGINQSINQSITAYLCTQA